MVRFILKRTVCDQHTNYIHEGFETIDIDVPQLEELLNRGGLGRGFDETKLEGVELISPK